MQSTAHAPAGRREWLGLAVLALPTLLVSMDMTILHLATPSLRAELRPTGSELLWVSDIYGFLIAGALIPMGALGDRIGRRRLLLIGSVFFGLASILAAFSSSARMLIASRAILGIAGATLLPSTLAMIRSLFPSPKERSIAIGIWTTCFTLGGVVGPIVGGLLLHYYWWGSVFLVGVPVMVALVILGPIFLPEVGEDDGGAVDIPSVAMSVTALLAIAYGVKGLAEAGVTMSAAGALVVGGAVGWAFIRRQGRLTTPLVDLGLFRNGAFTAALGANMMALFAWVGASLLVAQYLQLVIGMSPMTAGLWTIPPAIACVVGCLGAPMLVQRFAPAALVTLALLLVAAGFAIMATFTSALGLAAIVPGMIILGLGVATVVTLCTDLILATAPRQKAGAASAISETGADLGGSFGVAVLGSVSVAVYRTSVAIPEGLAGDRAATVRATLGAAVDVANTLPSPSGSVLRASARQAFEQGLVFASVAGFCVVLSTAILFASTNLRRSARPTQFKLRRSPLTNEQSEPAIRAVINEWADAICKGDIHRVLANRTDDIVMYDVPEPTQATGIEAYKNTWKLFFDHNVSGPDRFRLNEVRIVAGDDVAYVHGLLTIGGGDARCRLTLGLRRIDGAWKVTHEHHSMPIKLD